MIDYRLGRDEILWRRIHKDHFIDGRITTAAFKDPEMSVDIARLRVEMSLTLADGVGVASFSSGLAYDNGQVVFSDPVPGNPAHALVIGNKPRSIRKAFCKASAFASRESIKPPNSCGSPQEQGPDQ
ncbi:MAG: hypothetical protein F4X21_02575 [Acidimicrobiia bacterium]|nr:hypothetical protein [Acidimicrobiia bacterium]